MIDIAVVRDNPDLVRASQRARGEDEAAVDRLLAADEAHRRAIREFENLRAEQKSLSVQIGKVSPEERPAMLDRAKKLSEDVTRSQSRLHEVRSSFDGQLRDIGNLVEPGVPAGGEDDFAVLGEYGTVRSFATEGFAPRDHTEIGESLGLLDITRGVKISGSRFYFLKGVGSLLELGLLRLGLDRALQAGFTPLTPPVLVSPPVMEGAGYLDRHADAVYQLADNDLYLTGTSEVALAGYHSDEIINLDGGPKRYVSWSTCFRREAGAYGKDVGGIIRVHQFQKVEMFSYCDDADSPQEHDFLLGLQQDMLSAIEVPFRVIDTAAGDLGDAAARKYDCEAWIPSENRYREMTSASNCRTFQARRLKVRQRVDGKSRIVATLNGTIATTRWLVAILENHQQADGSVRIPHALQPYIGLDVIRPGHPYVPPRSAPG